MIFYLFTKWLLGSLFPLLVGKLGHQEVSCGRTAPYLASCRGTYGDGSSLDDDKDSDYSGGTMVLDLPFLGALYGSKKDLV